jgi:hypothetical protein
MTGRSVRADVRNPLVTLPSFQALTRLEEPERSLIRLLLLDLQADARVRADACWRRRKPPMAAYWAAVGVYAGHAARALKAPGRLKERGEGLGDRPDSPPTYSCEETGLEHLAPRRRHRAATLLHPAKL